ncbi:hypothetical protein STVA_35190 [Allostella vacuolata]|nr:hypothetical protein STVA_35190 [Stella vacuolata]
MKSPTQMPAAPAPAPSQFDDEIPSWFAIAQAEIGEKEIDGSGSNPRITEYFTATTLGAQPDHVPWCGAFVSFCLREAGILNKGSARAADWLRWGQTLTSPRPGCVVVLKPQAAGASGHVGFWVKEEGGKIFLLAGNQSNQVNVTRFDARELVRDGYRWPSRT